MFPKMLREKPKMSDFFHWSGKVSKEFYNRAAIFQTLAWNFRTKCQLFVWILHDVKTLIFYAVMFSFHKIIVNKYKWLGSSPGSQYMLGQMLKLSILINGEAQRNFIVGQLLLKWMIFQFNSSKYAKIFTKTELFFY